MCNVNKTSSIRTLVGGLRRNQWLLGTAALLALAGISRADINFALDFPNNTGSSQSSLTITLDGDQTAAINSIVNPFGGTYSASYDPIAGKTTVTISGSNSIAPSFTLDPGMSITVPPNYFLDPGIVIGSGSGKKFGPNFWLNTPTPIGPPKFVLVYAVATQVSTGDVGSNWYEAPYEPGNSLTLYASSTAGTVDLSSAEYFISDTQIPLDQLNATDYPPTDPSFQPIPGVSDGTQLAPGSPITVLPEPTAVALLAAGAVGLLLLRKRRLACSKVI